MKLSIVLSHETFNSPFYSFIVDTSLSAFSFSSTSVVLIRRLYFSVDFLFFVYFSGPNLAVSNWPNLAVCLKLTGLAVDLSLKLTKTDDLAVLDENGRSLSLSLLWRSISLSFWRKRAYIDGFGGPWLSLSFYLCLYCTWTWTWCIDCGCVKEKGCVVLCMCLFLFFNLA